MTSTEDRSLDIDAIIPAIYQYLDGNLSSDYGSYPEKIKDTLDKNDLINPRGITKTRDVEIITSLIPFYNIITDFNVFCSDFAWRKRKILKKLDKNKDVIILACTYLHAITIYISYDDIKTGYDDDTKSVNIVFINSGDGLANHDKHPEKDLYNLWKSYKISKKDFDKFLYKLLIFQGTLAVIKINSNDGIDDSFFKTKCVTKPITEERKKIERSMKKVRCNMREIYGEDHISDNNINNILITKYYSLISRHLLDLDKTPIWNDGNNIGAFIQHWEQNKIDTSIKEYQKIVFSKNSFIYENNTLYTEPQKSGSCGWFSLYWALIMHLIRSCDIENIFKYLHLLNDELYKMLRSGAYAFMRHPIDNIYTKIDTDVLDILNLGNIIYEIGLVTDEKILSENKIIHSRSALFTIDLKNVSYASDKEEEDYSDSEGDDFDDEGDDFDDEGDDSDVKGDNFDDEGDNFDEEGGYKGGG